jgi:hypothetical protein
MAQSINAQALDSTQMQQRSDSSLWKLRLALGWIILLGYVVGFFAFSWDIQWHSAVGRDRTLTAPHLFILGGVTFTGLVALAAVLIETMWARRNASVAKSSMPFAGFFSSSLGAYLVGYGSLTAAIAFPVDQYWHTLYGIDVSIWAPFHIMEFTGFFVGNLGAAYMLANGARLAARHGAKWAERAGYVGVIVALATLMGAFTFVLLPSIGSQGYIPLGSLTFTVYPLMLGGFATFILVIAIRALPWRIAATSVAAVYVLFGWINTLIIPPLMAFTLAAEQQRLLPGARVASVVAREWQYSLIIAAVLLDVVVWIAARKEWSLQKANRRILVAAMIGISLSALFSSSFLLLALVRSGFGLISGAKLSPAGEPGPTPSILVFVVIVVVSLLVGLLGTYVGNWFGSGVGESMRREERS